MKPIGLYSLKQERLAAERQQSIIRLLLSLTTSLVLIKCYLDQAAPEYADLGRQFISLDWIIALIAMFMSYSIAMWALVKWRPDKLKVVVAASSIIEILLITFLYRSTQRLDVPFHMWYVFYVVSVAIRYGWQCATLALSASIVSFTAVVCMSATRGFTTNVPFMLGYTSFLLVMAFMFGQLSERQFNYQARLSVVNEFRAELAGMTTSKDIINHLLDQAKVLLNMEQAFFLPAKRGADASEAPGLRSQGSDPVMMSTFREGGGGWNVESILKEQRPILSNRPTRDTSFPAGAAAKLGLRNIVAAPMMVRSVPVGVVYAVNRRDKRLSNGDLQLLELIATQAAPVVENALLWERLREAAASEERLRIARDLHDNFLQTLAAIKIHLERCKILVDKDTARALDGIERIHQIATRGLAEVRSYLSELRLMGPEPSRFREAVSRCANDAAIKGGFEASVDIETPEELMPPNIALAAFQIIRELLNNAAAHSGAKNVQVKAYIEDGRMLIEVEDDGIGFDVARVRAEKASEGHLGLVGVEERARQSDGTLTLTSEPGKGTKASAYLSL